MAPRLVDRLPKDPGPAGWNRILPPPPLAQRLESNIIADWLVIGAGFAGLAAARRLSQLRETDRIVVLDATRIAEGPAGRNSGFMIDLPHNLSSSSYSGAIDADRNTIADNRAGIDFAASMARDFGLSREAFDPCGKINAASTERGVRNNTIYAKHIRSLGETCEELTATEMAEITGTTYYKGGLFTPGVSVIQPALYVRGIAEGLRSNRVELYENSPVVSLGRENDWCAKTPNGSVTAPRVILAVNGHLNSFGFMGGRLLHVFTYASMTRALSPAETKALGGRSRWGLTSADPMGSSVRRISGIGGDRIVIRNRFTCDPAMEVPENRIAQVALRHDQSFAARFPELSGIDMEYRWGGRLCLSLNDVQVVKELAEGLFAACCQNGLGTAKGTLAGKLAAELAIGIDSPALQRMTTANAPKRLPPEKVARFGASLRMKWGERRAGREI